MTTHYETQINYELTMTSCGVFPSFGVTDFPYRFIDSGSPVA